MGIKSLHRWLRWVCSPPETVQWSKWSNKKLGIDILGLLYKAKQEGRNPIEEIAHLIIHLKQNEIVPIFVFDGKSPAEKRSTCAARRRQKEQLSEADQKLACIPSEERNQIKQLMYASGCLYLNANGEADTVLAYLYKKSEIDAILSMDMDFLARGCNSLIVPYKTLYQFYSLPTILTQSKLTYEQFVDMCVLLGTDYNPSIPTLSYQRIYWSILIGNLSMSEILAKEGIRNNTLWLQAKQILLGDSELWNTILSEKQRDKWIQGSPSVEAEFCASLFPTWSQTSLNWLLYKAPGADSKSAVTASDCNADFATGATV
jgi:hypothetical protein